MTPVFSIPFLAQGDAAPPDELYDIIEIAPETSIWPFVVYSLLLLLLVAGAALAIRHFLRSRKTSPSKEPAIGIAERQLRELESTGDTLEPNRYALALSETLKDFLAATFSDPVRYETTQEFLARLSRDESTRLPPAAQQELRDFLIAAEEVKFGHAPGSESKTTPLLQKAKSLLALCTAINSESRHRLSRQG
jgi:hypothetical protein